MTSAQFRKLGFEFVNGDWQKVKPGAKAKRHENTSRPKLQSAKSERHKAAALDAANEGEAEGIQRIVVRFVGWRVRPLDPDNFSGGAKDVLDGLRHAGIIPGDSPEQIDFQTTQVRVRTKAEERTEIFIEFP